MCTRQSRRLYLGCNVGEKGLREMSGPMNLGNIELLSQATREQPTKHQETLKFTNTPNLKI